MRVQLVLLGIVLLVGLPLLAEDGYGPLVNNGVDEELAIGADLFFSETFNGNQRTCSTCHLAEENYTLPADLGGVSESSPLMVGDPDNPHFVRELELCDTSDSTENCQALRQNGLVLVNADGYLPGPDGFRSYSMRSVPHTLSLRTSLAAPAGPYVDRTGWAGDGSPNDGSLLNFALGAVRQHFTRNTDRVPGVDFREPTEEELQAMEAFQLELGRRNDIDLDALTLLDDNALAGRTTFDARCSRCHNNAGALSSGINQNFNTHIEEDRMAACPDSNDPGRCAEDSALLVPGANFDGGFGTDDLSPDDYRWGDGSFNTPPLIEAADTGPFFHDNSRETLETAITFYRSGQFLDSPACENVANCGLSGTPLPLTEAEIGAMLRILNAGLNIAMAAQRTYGAKNLLNTEPGDDPTVIKTLTLAREEIEDARDSIAHVKFGSIPVFADTGGNISDARAELDQVLTSLDGMIANGTSALQIASVLSQMIAVAEDHLSPDFYDESPSTCASRGVQVSSGQYHDCRWVFDLGDANLLFDNAGVAPSVVAGQTELTWTPNPDGTATLDMKWRTAEWTNPLFDETVLSDISKNPSFQPITFTGSATPLANGQWERTFSYTIPCVPNARYKMEISARVGGETETDSDTVKAGKYCIGR